MVARFVKFYRANAATSLPYVDRWAKPYRDGPDWDDEQSWVDYRSEIGGGYSRWSADDVRDPDYLREQAIVVADCGHEVDLGDPRTFVESAGGSVVECVDCGCPRLPGDDWDVIPGGTS